MTTWQNRLCQRDRCLLRSEAGRMVKSPRAGLGAGLNAASSKRAPSPGSQVALRARNTDRILAALQAHGPSTQAQLVRITGLSNGTVNNIVHALADERRVVLQDGTSSGRRAKIIRLSAENLVAIGIDIGRRHVRVILADAGFHVIAEQSIPLPTGHIATDVLEKTHRLLDHLMRASGIEMEQVIGVGIGIPGPINQSLGIVSTGTVLPGWSGVPLQLLHDQFDVPVFIANDADLGALAEITWGASRGLRNLIFVKVGTGIGAGLILNGEAFTGASGMTGEIGHTHVSGSNHLCACGKRGCLEATASTRRILEDFQRDHGSAGIDDFLRAVEDRSEQALNILDEVCAALAESVIALSSLLAPERVVLGGPLAPLGDEFAVGVRTHIDRIAATSPNAGSMDIVTSSLADRAEALGATSLVFRQVGLVSL